jgi:hypothetical protein
MHESATRLAGEVVEDLARFLDAARGTDLPWADATIHKTCIRRNIKLAESASFGQTVFDYAPRCNGAADYARLAAEVFGDTIAAPDIGTDRVTVVDKPVPVESATREVDRPAADFGGDGPTDPAAQAACAQASSDPPEPRETGEKARPDTLDPAPVPRC